MQVTEPIYTEQTATDEDKYYLLPRQCESCGTIMDNGLDDICAECCERLMVEDALEDLPPEAFQE